MKKIFKGVTGKIFSIVLVLCMVASMLPAITVSATEIGESVTYDFTAPGKGVDLSAITEESGYNWSYGGSKINGYTATVESTDSGIKYLYMNGDSGKARPRGVWYALEINTEALSAGVYSAKLKYRQYKKDYNLKGDIYLIPKSAVDDRTENEFVEKIFKKLKTDGKKLRLVNLQAKLKKLFVICALDAIMEIA